MDPVNVIQLVFAGAAALVFGRVGFALARYIERRLSGTPIMNQEAESRSARTSPSESFNERPEESA